MSLIGRLGVNLSVNSTEFVKGIGDAAKKAKEFETENKKRLKASEEAMQEMMQTVGVAAAGFTAFAAVMTKTFQKADEISDMAKGFDMSVESLLAAQQALQQSGGEAGNYATMLQKLANAQDGAKEGTDAMRDSFARLGIKAGEVENLKVDELFKRVAVALSGVEDSGKRAAMAQDLLGKAVKGVSWSDFVKNYSEFKDPALVAAIEKNAQAWGDIEKAIKDISMGMQKMAVPFAGMVSDSVKIADNVNAMFKSFDLNMPKFLQYEKVFRAVFAPFLMLPEVLEKLNKIAAAGKKLVTGGDVDNSGMGFPTDSSAGLLGGGYAKESAADKAQATARQKLISEVKKANSEYEKRAKLLNQTLTLEEASLKQAGKKLTLNSEDLALDKLRHDLYVNRTKLFGEKEREIADANFEYESKSGKEKNKKLLDVKLENINKYYKAADDGQQKNYELAVNLMQEEFDLKKLYFNEDLKNQKDKELEAIRLRYNAQQDLLSLDSQAYKLSTNDYNYLKLKITAAQELAALQTRYAEKALEIKTEYERTAMQPKDEELAKAKYKQLDEINASEYLALTRLDEKREENFRKDIERQQSWGAGWDEALKNYTETAEKASNRGAAAFEMVTANMETAIRKFVDTGKFAFSDLVGSIIKDLLYMELRAQASSMFKMLWGSISASFGKSSTSISSGSGVAFGGSNLMGFASGGYVDSPSIVGENGAELFIPNTPGTIIPNGSWQQMASGGGGGGLTVNGNYIASMNAIDTQSATQFLAKNKSTIWAAYQSANRSVPISR